MWKEGKPRREERCGGGVESFRELGLWQRRTHGEGGQAGQRRMPLQSKAKMKRTVVRGEELVPQVHNGAQNAAAVGVHVPDYAIAPRS